MENTENEVSLSDSQLRAVLTTMLRYNRTEGFIAMRGDKLMFFDSDPGDGAAITRDELIQSIFKKA